MMRPDYKIGLIGCGVIGERRLGVIERTGLGSIAGVYDIAPERAQKCAERFHTHVAADAEELIRNPEIDIILLATANHALGHLGELSLRNGKHTFIEKPGAIDSGQVRKMLDAGRDSGREPRCKIGYNHRFHPAALRLHEELQSGRHGKVSWIRGAYGHGGRPGYEKEWRFQKELSGGGEIIDQGVHLLDLVRWWTAEPLDLAFASRQNAHYRSTEEDNGFLLLRSDGGTHAQLHCSVTQWKNIFRIEVGTEHSLLVWEGLGNRNYGPETLTIHRRKPEGGAPESERLTFETGGGSDESWEKEWRHFYAALSSEEPLWSSLEESEWVFDILTKAYETPVHTTIA